MACPTPAALRGDEGYYPPVEAYDSQRYPAPSPMLDHIAVSHPHPHWDAHHHASEPHSSYAPWSVPPLAPSSYPPSSTYPDRRYFSPVPEAQSPPIYGYHQPRPSLISAHSVQSSHPQYLLQPSPPPPPQPILYSPPSTSPPEPHFPPTAVPLSPASIVAPLWDQAAPPLASGSGSQPRELSPIASSGPPSAAPSAGGDGNGKKKRKPRAKRGEPKSDDDERKYRCHLCTGDDVARFARPSALRIHLLTHTKEQPFECYFCQRRFSVQSNLRRHERIHQKKNEQAGNWDQGQGHSHGYKHEEEDGIGEWSDSGGVLRSQSDPGDVDVAGLANAQLAVVGMVAGWR
ncbi:zinc finger, C2H2-type domain containing protein [Pseudohyphozyma bogoriensis]|nr:zinc finger, C2H2-type domain containing protein [Pseudohyphozyma bogoriensis]